jgi:PAS domain S-box-containing protein
MSSNSGGEVGSGILKLPIRTLFGLARIAPWLVLVLCLALSWLLWNATKDETQSKLQDYFDFRVRQAVSLTEQRVLAQEQILRGLRGLYAASDKINRSEFHDYVASLKLDENYPGIQGVGYAQIVPRAEINKHTEAVRKESGHPEYRIHPEGKRDLYTSIVDLEPFSGRNLRAFGYDMYSEPVRRAAMERARDTGMASLSAKVLLVQETDQHPQAGFLIYLPVYRNGAPHKTVQERRANIVGWVYSPFRMDDLAQGMYGERAKDLDIEIYDGEKVTPDALMYDSQKVHKSGSQNFSSIQRLKIKNHIWTLSIRATPLFLSREEEDEPLIVAFVGIGFSLLFSLLTWLLVTGRERAIPYAQKMNRELILKEQALKESTTLLENIIDNIPNMIFLKRANDLRYELLNRAGEILTGHSREEIIGKNDYDFATKEQADSFVEKDRDALRQSGVVDIPEEYLNTLHGIRILHTKKISLRDAQGQPKYLLGISEDITERKQNEQMISRFFDQPMAMHLICSIDGTVLRVNSAWESVLGYQSDELVGTNILDLIHPDDKAKSIAELSNLDKGMQTLHFENRYRHKNGEYKILNWSANVSTEDKSVYAIAVDITKRKQAEISLIKSNRALAALSAVNHSLVHSNEEHELLLAVCQAIVRQSNYRMAWVGYLEQDTAKTIRPVAQDGFEEGYLGQALITWADTERGRGPTGRAARSGQTQVSQNIQTDASMLPWRTETAKRGMASCISLPLIDTGKVFGVLVIYSGYIDAFGKEDVRLLEEMANDLTFGIKGLHISQERDLALKENKRQLAQLQDSLEDTVKAISTIVEMRDPYTAGHQNKVAELAVAIAKEMGMPDEQVHGIHLAGVVHDLGKIQVPAEILSMPRRLTEIEYSFIKGHPQAGYDILKDIDFPWPIAQMVLQHHERMDGSGYPQGLKGDQILLGARILCVADVVEAMSSHRPYRAGLGIEVALNEIEKNRGTLYDAKVVDACLKLFGEGRFNF